MNSPVDPGARQALKKKPPERTPEHRHLHLRGEQCWSKRGQIRHSAWIEVHVTVVPAYQSSRPFLICCPYECQ
ncbi:hypothetical protein CB1_000719025 [Camelus ferus]|nr:hypothetical protein CB1_000719025 [Camelus ferus]